MCSRVKDVLNCTIITNFKTATIKYINVLVSSSKYTLTYFIQLLHILKFCFHRIHSLKLQYSVNGLGTQQFVLHSGKNHSYHDIISAFVYSLL